jgi:hypothetical protein
MEDIQGRGYRWMVQGYAVILLALPRSKADLAGTTAHFFRIFPHTVVTLVANEVFFVPNAACTSTDNLSSSWPNTGRCVGTKHEEGASQGQQYIPYATAIITRSVYRE